MYKDKEVYLSFYIIDDMYKSLSGDVYVGTYR